uniref:Uncharacterized protein n=1 Tax=Trypanosoma congolense (strain IL3000) TaxID=1068625 RepID=G0UT97_TRYCI|nr:hypothetical protein, unlikely [Trypanosoma congolense IL3000]
MQMTVIPQHLREEKKENMAITHSHIPFFAHALPGIASRKYRPRTCQMPVRRRLAEALERFTPTIAVTPLPIPVFVGLKPTPWKLPTTCFPFVLVNSSGAFKPFTALCRDRGLNVFTCSSMHRT